MLKMAMFDLFGIQYPVIRGGIKHMATAELGSAVSKYTLIFHQSMLKNR